MAGFHPRVANDHLVQFVPSEQAAADALAAFIATTWAHGDRFLIVARRKTWQDVATLARSQQFLGCGSLDPDRLVVLDAEDAMESFLRGGLPDPALFACSIGQLAARLRGKRSRLLMYSEMVDLLAAQDNFAATYALEDLCNQLAAEHDLTLVCGYSPERFASPHGWDHLQSVCTVHARILTPASDHWPAAATRDTPADSPSTRSAWTMNRLGADPT